MAGLRGDAARWCEAARGESKESKDFSEEDGEVEELLNCPSNGFCLDRLRLCWRRKGPNEPPAFESSF